MDRRCSFAYPGELRSVTQPVRPGLGPLDEALARGVRPVGSSNRRDGRAAECEALEKPWDATPRGFESLSLRTS